VKRLGLALGAGGARGLAHVGVLQGLAAAGIPVHAIAGTSIGALVGAVYLAGQLERFEAAVRALDWSDSVRIFDPTWRRAGLFAGERAAELIRGFLGDWRIEDLPLPFVAVAVDLVTGDEVWIRSGRVVDAVRASLSIPGVFTPVRQDERLLVDGALRNPVPVSALAPLGVEARLAVNLHARAGREAPAAAPKLLDVLSASMMVVEHELARHRLAREPADVVLEPDVRGLRTFEFHKAGYAIDAGRAEVERRVAEIRAALEPAPQTRRERLRRYFSFTSSS
jgi:NTE family protein